MRGRDDGRIGTGLEFGAGVRIVREERGWGLAEEVGHAAHPALPAAPGSPAVRADSLRADRCYARCPRKSSRQSTSKRSCFTLNISPPKTHDFKPGLTEAVFATFLVVEGF